MREFFNNFMAGNSKQLGICLEMLYIEDVQFTVQVIETDARKIAYVIYIQEDKHTYDSLRDKYMMLIS